MESLLPIFLYVPFLYSWNVAEALNGLQIVEHIKLFGSGSSSQSTTITKDLSPVPLPLIFILLKTYS